MNRAWNSSEGSGPLLAAAVLGMIVTFGAGWLLAGARAHHTDASGQVSPGRTLPAEDPATSAAAQGSAGSLPTDLPTDSLNTAGSPSAQIGVAGLPAVSKASRAPIGAFDCPSPTVGVSTAKQLTAALAAARPGAVISLARGVYRGKFVTSRSGTAKKPIYLCGARDAVLDGGGIKGGYVLYLNRASYWRVSGFTVQDGQKGVMLDGATGVGLQGLLVQQIGDEAVHLRRGSTLNVVRGLTIRQTGLRKDKFGEGVYVGSAQSNWCDVNKCRPDQSDSNFVIGNVFSATSAEAVDIKEGTSSGVVAGNRFDGAGITGADSWVDVKGNGWLISGNQGSRAPVDGYQVHEILDGWGYRNVFSANISAVNATGYAIKVTKTHNDNVVQCNNRASAAGEGLTNISCS
jgi:hypothetical protein